MLDLYRQYTQEPVLHKLVHESEDDKKIEKARALLYAIREEREKERFLDARRWFWWEIAN